MKKNILVVFFISVLLSLSACGAGPASKASSANTAPSANTAAAPVNSSTSQYLGDFQAIPGTTYLYAEISQKPDSGSGLRNLISSITSSQDFGSTSNLVFLDSKTLNSHKLFAANDQIILSVLQFPDPYGASGSASSVLQAQPVQPAQPAQAANAKSNMAVQWLIYQVVKKEAGQPSTAATANLPFSIAVSDASGNGYKEVLSGLTKTYAINLLNSKQLLVVYTKNEVKTACVIDLAKRTVLTSNQLVDLGSGVQ